MHAKAIFSTDKNWILQKKKDARKKLNLDMNSGYTHLNTFKPKGGFYSEVTD